MAATLPSPGCCECPNTSSSSGGGNGNAPQQIYYSAGTPVGLQVGVDGKLQNPVWPAFCMDTVNDITYRWTGSAWV